MATINEIKNLIKTKIEGQGSQVDIGNGLPNVLNGVADLIQQTQVLMAEGYLFMGYFSGSRGIQGETELPEPREKGNFFIIYCNLGDEECYNFIIGIWSNDDRKWYDSGTLDLYQYNTGNAVRESESSFDGFVTPKALVEYALPYEDFSDYENGDELSQDDWHRLEDAIVIKYRGEFWSRIEVICNTWVDVIAALWDDQYSPIRIFGSLQYEMQNGVPTLTNINAVCLAQDNNGKEYFAVAEI